MGSYLSTRDGKLTFSKSVSICNVPNSKFENEPFIEEPLPFVPPRRDHFKNGDLNLLATQDNILAVCQSVCTIFLQREGIKLPKGYFDNYPGLDVTKQYKNIPSDIDPEDEVALNQYRHSDNLTCGWCYLVSGTIHRFFYKYFDMYRCETDNDYHWWLQNSNGDIIDLTYEQFIKSDSKYNRYYFRKQGHNRSRPDDLTGVAQSVMKKTRNMSFIVATCFDYSAVQHKDMKMGRYANPIGHDSIS